MFKDWLTGNMGVPGEYQFQTMYWISLSVVVIALVSFTFLGASNASKKTKDIALKAVCIFQISFEVLWRIIYLTIKGDKFPAIWPMYPCNLGGVIIPIVSLLNLKKGKQMFYLFGIVGACLTFAVPEGIFSTSVFVFPILKSVLQHTGLLLIPAFEYADNRFRPSIKDYPFLVIGCLIHLFNCEVVDRWFGLTGDYIFLRSGMPFVIPGIYQPITFCTFALITFFALSYLTNIKESNEVLRKIFKKKA